MARAYIVKDTTPHSVSMNDDLESAIRKLVKSDLVACDFESGLCRFCLAVVESSNPQLLEPHSATCPWQRVRSHYFPAGHVIGFPTAGAA